jgi:hypothetical protein
VIAINCLITNCFLSCVAQRKHGFYNLFLQFHIIKRVVFVCALIYVMSR